MMRLISLLRQGEEAPLGEFLDMSLELVGLQGGESESLGELADDESSLLTQ